MPDREERERELKRANNQRYQRRLKAHRTCCLLEIDDFGLSALVWAGLLPEREAELKDSIKSAAQRVFDAFVAEERRKRGF